jgi:leader peptidase (prepilin peptidase) / N-methyltransferase
VQQLQPLIADRHASSIVAIIVGLLVVLASIGSLTPALAITSIMLALPLILIVLVDLWSFRIPDVLSLPLIPLGLAASGSLLHPGIEDVVDSMHAAGALAGGTGLWLVGATYEWLRQRAGLGLGDIKLAAAGGAWVGLDALPEILFFASSLGLLMLTALRCRNGANTITATTALPFGAFLAPAIWVTWFIKASAV